MNRSLVVHPPAPTDLATPGPPPAVGPAVPRMRAEATSADPAALRPAQTDLAPAPDGTRRFVLICDDRPAVRRELSQALRYASRDTVHEVPDGDALLTAYQQGADQVLIGVHSGTSVGTHAVALLLASHTDAGPIVFGSLTDIDALAAAYASGAGGLLMWEPRSADPPTR